MPVTLSLVASYYLFSDGNLCPVISLYLMTKGDLSLIVMGLFNEVILLSKDIDVEGCLQWQDVT